MAQTPTLEDLAAAYLTSVDHGPGKQTGVLDSFVDAAGSTSVRRLGRREVERWLARRSGVSLSTTRQELDTVRAFCAWLLAEGHVGRDPCANVRLPDDDLLYDFRHVSRGTAAGGLTEALLLRGLAPRTIAIYCRVIRDAANWCEDRGEALATVTPSTIAAYCASRPRTTASQGVIKAALKHYWQIKGRKDPPLTAIRVPPKRRMVCKALEVDEARTLARAALARGDSAGLAVLLGLYQALRREEIATLRWDCFGDDGWMTVTGKGSVTASIPTNPAITELLSRHPRLGPWIFPGTRGGHCHPATIWHWVRLVAEEAGLEGVTVHRLRHTSLAQAQDATGDLRSVQAFARHSRPEITSGYTRTTTTRLKAVMSSIEY